MLNGLLILNFPGTTDFSCYHKKRLVILKIVVQKFFIVFFNKIILVADLETPFWGRLGKNSAMFPEFYLSNFCAINH